MVKDTIIESISNLCNNILSGFKDLLSLLFIPDESNFLNLLIDIFNEKFAFISQTLDLAAQIKNITFDDEVPEFKIKLQGKFFGSLSGKEFKFIDLSMYHQYRGFIHSVVRAITIFYFILYLLRDIPCIVGGITSGTSMLRREDEVDYSILGNRSNSYDYY